jgi:hypothetical protein
MEKCKYFGKRILVFGVIFSLLNGADTCGDATGMVNWAPAIWRMSWSPHRCISLHQMSLAVLASR